MRFPSRTLAIHCSLILLCLSLIQSTALAQKWQDLIDQANEVTLSGDKKAAEQLYKLGAAEAKKQGEASPAYLMSLQELATFYEDQNRDEEALALYEKLIEITQLTGNPEIVSYLELSGDIYCKLDNLEETKKRYERSMALQEKAVGPNHPEIGKSLRDFARCYTKHQQYEEAAQLYQRMLTLQEKAKGAEDISMVGPLVEMGRFYKAQHKLAEAEKYYQKALTVFESFKKQHPKDARVGIVEELTLPVLKKELSETKAP